MKNSQNIKLYLATFVSLVTVLCYFTTLLNGFVEWDDDTYILENIHIRSLGLTFFRRVFLISIMPTGIH